MITPFCPYCQTTGWPVIRPCRCHEFTQRVHEIQQLRGPHRIEDCVIDDPDLDDLLNWWDEWQDVGGEA